MLSRLLVLHSHIVGESRPSPAHAAWYRRELVCETVGAPCQPAISPLLQLSAAEYVNGSILDKRDPVFQSMYNAVESAIDKCASLRRPNYRLQLTSNPTPAERSRSSDSWLDRSRGRAGSPADLGGKRRHPVTRVRAMLKSSACTNGRRDRGLVGSLFWRWDVQVYAGSGVADYGVRQFDSTFGARPALGAGTKQTRTNLHQTPAVALHAV
jgi:hypothetical protein